MDVYLFVLKGMLKQFLIKICMKVQKQVYIFFINLCEAFIFLIYDWQIDYCNGEQIIKSKIVYNQ